MKWGTRDAYRIVAGNREDHLIIFKGILEKYFEYWNWLGIRLSMGVHEQSVEPSVIGVGNILIS
jgi:hypothetical protein